MERCELLAIPYLVIHPGSHMGSGEEAGIARVVHALDIAHDRLPKAQVKVTLETTAGQGTNLGYRFEHLATMIDEVEAGHRLAVCYDTCHTLAAGYDFRTPQGYAQRVLGRKAMGMTFIKFDLGMDVLDGYVQGGVVGAPTPYEYELGQSWRAPGSQGGTSSPMRASPALWRSWPRCVMPSAGRSRWQWITLGRSTFPR